MSDFINRNRRKLTVGGIVGVIVAIGAGVAVAGVLLSLNFSGSTAYADANASFDVTGISVQGQTGGVTCTATKTGGNSVVINPVVKRIVNGSATQTIPGDCSIKLVVKNTGQTKLNLANFAFDGASPAGWSLASQGGPNSINVGQQVEFTAVVKAGSSAAAAPFKAKLDLAPVA